MNDLERKLRSAMGDAEFEAAYRSAFGRLRADRFGDYPLHMSTLYMVQSMLQMRESMRRGEEPFIAVNPFGGPGVDIPEPDSLRILQNIRSSSKDSSQHNESSGCYIATAVYGSYDCPPVWTLRRFPIFAVFGDGRYHIQPVHVDDLAKLMAEQGMGSENTVVNALGPEDYTYRDLVAMIRKELGLTRPIIGVPPALGWWASLAVGKVVGDVFVTREEIAGLMADTLHVPGAVPTGETRLSEWVRENRQTLGQSYHGEMPRRRDRAKAY